MVDSATASEMVSVFEDVYDKKSAAKVQVKEASTELKDYAISHDLEPSVVNSVYSSYAKYRDGKEDWTGEADSDGDDYVSILVAVQDVVLNK